MYLREEPGRWRAHTQACEVPAVKRWVDNGLTPAKYAHGILVVSYSADVGHGRVEACLLLVQRSAHFPCLLLVLEGAWVVDLLGVLHDEVAGARQVDAGALPEKGAT